MGRMFSVPYSMKIDTSSYMSLLSEYPDIHSVYMGLPILHNHLSLQHGRDVTNESVYDFLEKSEGLYKRIVVYNSISYNNRALSIVYYNKIRYNMQGSYNSIHRGGI